MKEKTIEEIKNWIQLRIDYWEKTIESTVGSEYSQFCTKQAYCEGEAEGTCQAFYEVLEFINGQRK